MYGICYDIVKKYWAAWGRLFWKRSVSPSFLGVFLCCFGFVFGWVLFLVGFDLFGTGRHLAFCFHLFSNMWEQLIKDNTFWWPSEPRACTAWGQKKKKKCSCKVAAIEAHFIPYPWRCFHFYLLVGNLGPCEDSGHGGAPPSPWTIFVIPYLIFPSLPFRILVLGKRPWRHDPFQVSLSMPIWIFSILGLGKRLLSSHSGRLLLFHGRVFHCRSSWPPTDLSERSVHFAKEVCHLVAFQWYAACWCIISQTPTAASTRKSCLRMEAGCCPSTAGS